MKMNQTELALQAGTTKKSQIDYEHGRVPSFASYLEAIATAGVDVQYLLTGVRATEPVLTPDEKKLIDCWRDAPPAVRKTTLEVLRSGMVITKQVHVGRDNFGDINI